jgi:uncharacterized protein YndB with AHSA1/START domain
VSEYGAIVEDGTVRLERVLPGPIETVWAYLTDSDKRGEWLAPGPMDLRVGGRVELNFHHADLTPHVETIPETHRSMENGHTMTGVVTRCEPPRLLAYTWSEETGGHSEVAFELSPRGDDVLLVLTHRRLGARAMMVSVAAGWHAHVGILIDKMHGRKPAPFWATYERLAKDYERRLCAL